MVTKRARRVRSDFDSLRVQRERQMGVFKGQAPLGLDGPLGRGGPPAQNPLVREDGRIGLLGLSGASGVGGSAKGADQVGLRSRLGLNVIGQVVGVGAREDVAARGDQGVGQAGGGEAGRVDHLDAVDVVGVDDGRDVKEGLTGPAVEGDLAEHARDVGLAGRDRVEVALPVLGDIDDDALESRHDGGGDHTSTGVAGEVDGAVGGILGDQSDGVGSGRKGSAGEEGSKAGELHLCGLQSVLRLMVFQKEKVLCDCVCSEAKNRQGSR